MARRRRGRESRQREEATGFGEPTFGERSGRRSQKTFFSKIPSKFQFQRHGKCAASDLVHCCTLSLCYLGAETGYRVATPYRRVQSINGATEAKFDQFGPVFLQKVHVNMDSGNVFFFGPSYLLFLGVKSGHF